MPNLRRRATASRGVRVQRAPSTWSRFVPAVLTTVPAASKVLLLTLSLNNAGIGETVRRTRGRAYFVSDQAAVPNEIQLGAFGFTVVSDVAAAVGITAIPGPVTEKDDDGWYVWESILGQGSNGQAGQTSEVGTVIEFDSKAMRRIEEGYLVAIVVENAHATQGFVFGLSISSLSSLS